MWHFLFVLSKPALLLTRAQRDCACRLLTCSDLPCRQEKWALREQAWAWIHPEKCLSIPHRTILFFCVQRANKRFWLFLVLKRRVIVSEEGGSRSFPGYSQTLSAVSLVHGIENTFPTWQFLSERLLLWTPRIQLAPHVVQVLFKYGDQQKEFISHLLTHLT